MLVQIFSRRNLFHVISANLRQLEVIYTARITTPRVRRNRPRNQILGVPIVMYENTDGIIRYASPFFSFFIPPSQHT